MGHLYQKGRGTYGEHANPSENLGNTLSGTNPTANLSNRLEISENLEG